MTFIELVKIMRHVLIMPATKDHFPLDKSMETNMWSVYGEEPMYTDDQVYNAQIREIVPADCISGIFKDGKLYAVLDLD